MTRPRDVAWALRWIVLRPWIARAKTPEQIWRGRCRICTRRAWPWNSYRLAKGGRRHYQGKCRGLQW